MQDPLEVETLKARQAFDDYVHFVLAKRQSETKEVSRLLGRYLEKCCANLDRMKHNGQPAADRFEAKHALTEHLRVQLGLLHLVFRCDNKPCLLMANKGLNNLNGYFLLMPQQSGKPLVIRSNLADILPYCGVKQIGEPIPLFPSAMRRETIESWSNRVDGKPKGNGRSRLGDGP